MYRYWLLPLILTIISMLLPTVYVLEAYSIYAAIEYAQGLTVTMFTDPAISEVIGDIFEFTFLWGLGAGLVISCGAVAWDTVKNGLTDRHELKTIGLLFGNLFWCGLYAACFAFSNIVLVGVLNATHVLPAALETSVLILIVATFALNIIAFLWAILRSINTSEVLTPRVLVGKLRRSTQLQNV